jgi:hypothetical protein
MTWIPHLQTRLTSVLLQISHHACRVLHHQLHKTKTVKFTYGGDGLCITKQKYKTQTSAAVLMQHESRGPLSTPDRNIYCSVNSFSADTHENLTQTFISLIKLHTSFHLNFKLCIAVHLPCEACLMETVLTQLLRGRRCQALGNTKIEQKTFWWQLTFESILKDEKNYPNTW